jgi:hypothetical protein
MPLGEEIINEFPVVGEVEKSQKMQYTIEI